MALEAYLPVSFLSANKICFSRGIDKSYREIIIYKTLSHMRGAIACMMFVLLVQELLV